ncbi:MAG: hypothetical protein RIT02_3019 [Planctomycetota bacterium]|jgi:YHS domain-containing protein
MKTEKWVCRTFVVAAMSATVAVPMSGAAQGMQDSAVSRNSGKAQVQSASHGTSVNGELQKLFQQSGQEMPSMRSQDLPNAQNMQSQLVRKKPAEPVKKENVFKKFWGKVTGRGTAPAAAPAPVPPDYREPAPASATAGPAGGLRRTAPQPAAAASKAAGARPAFPTIMKPAATPAGEPAAVPPVAGHSLRPRTVVSEPAAAGPAGLPALSGKPSRFVQPGAAPSFMPKAEAAAAATAASAAAAAKQVSSAADATVDAVKKQSEFPDLFGGAEADEAADPLDLDAIAEAMKDQESSVKQQASEAADAIAETVQQKAAAADAVVQEAEQALKSVAEENPFTGVILEQQKETLPEAIQFEEAEAAQQPRVAQPPVFEPSLPAEPPAFPAAAPATTETEAGAATAGESQAAPSEQLRSLPDEKLRVAMENDERQKQLTRIRERGQQTGFKGFCPVALRDHRELIDADSAITAQFGLQTYSFSSEQARSLFEADPTRYAPASGGCDVVVLAREGVERPGRLDFALWFRGRLYMFETRDSMSEFHASPRTFAVEQ